LACSGAQVPRRGHRHDVLAWTSAERSYESWEKQTVLASRLTRTGEGLRGSIRRGTVVLFLAFLHLVSNTTGGRWEMLDSYLLYPSCIGAQHHLIVKVRLHVVCQGRNIASEVTADRAC
jgi:hypothetical protein